MVTLRRNSKRVIFLLSSMLAASLSAQTAADTKSDQPASDELIELSPFSVTTEKDSGYRASNSIGGTRSNTPIKDISLNIQVFTKDLQNDLVTADQTQLERYNAALVNGNADVQSDNVIQQAYGAFLFRGFVQNWGMRDGVREYDPVDSIGISRVELVKGPAAALYGLSYAGGVMNTITKQVDMTKNFTELRFQATDTGTLRGTIDANFVGKLANKTKAGLRYSGAAATTKDKRDHSKGRTRYNLINFELQPFEGTAIQLMVENQQKQKPNGLGYYGLSTTNNPSPIDAKYAGQVTGIGANVPMQVLRKDIPWTWNWANATNSRALETRRYKLSVNQAIGENLHLNAYFQNNTRVQPDSQGWDEGGNSQNAAGWDVGGGGWMLNSAGQEVIRKYYHWRDWTDMDHAQGVTGVYKLETGPIKNTITFGWANWDERFTSHKALDTVAGVDSKGNPIQVLADPFDLPAMANIDTSAAPEPANFKLVEPGGNREHNQNSYYFGAWQIAAIDNRLKLNFAMNHTKINNRIWNDVNGVYGGTPAQQQYSGKVDISKNSPMIGAMFDVTKEISVFAVHSTSLFPTTDKNDELTVQMPPEVGKSDEFGVKIELLNGKVSGTISYYKIKKTGGGVRDPNANNANKLIWDQLYAADLVNGVETWTGINAKGWSHNRSLVTSSADGITGNLGDIVPAELESKGLEADIVIQPTTALQFVISYAHNTEESVAGATKGQVNGGHVKDQIAGLVKYSFNEGVVKGLFIGSGFQAGSKSNADYVNDINGNIFARYNPSTFYLEAFAGYKFKAAGFNQSIQLNAKNLTKQDDFYGWKSVASDQVANSRYRVPTYVNFSVTYGLDF